MKDVSSELDKIESAVRSIRAAVNSVVGPNTKTFIVIHHSASVDHPLFDWGEIRRWHLKRGWVDIGYHYGIEKVDGGYEVLLGRFEQQNGAHCRHQRMNRIGIGICCIGNFDNTPPPPDQWEKCLLLTRSLMVRLGIPKENVLGHGEVEGTATACPGKFWDMNKFRQEL